MFLGGAVARFFHSYFVFYCMPTLSEFNHSPDDGHLSFFHFDL